MSPDKRTGLRQLRDRLRALVEIDLELPDEDSYQSLLGERAEPHLFLGHYDRAELRERMEHFGVGQRLKERGLSSWELHLDTTDHQRQTLRVVADGVHIAETAMRVGWFQTRADFAPLLHGERIRALFILWLMMQDPRARFTAARPALPGQSHPGLGIGRHVAQMYEAVANRLGCDAILNCPEFGHTAVLYSGSYRFLDPVAEGRLAAMRRDMAHLTLAQGSWALHLGCLVQRGSPPRPCRWQPEEQVHAIRGPLVDHFLSPAYRQAVERSLDAHRFFVDEERLRSRWPLDEDGAPREG